MLGAAVGTLLLCGITVSVRYYADDFRRICVPLRRRRDGRRGPVPPGHGGGVFDVLHMVRDAGSAGHDY